MLKENQKERNHVRWLVTMTLDFSKMITYISTESSISSLQSKILHKTIQ